MLGSRSTHRRSMDSVRQIEPPNAEHLLLFSFSRRRRVLLAVAVTDPPSRSSPCNSQACTPFVRESMVASDMLTDVA